MLILWITTILFGAIGVSCYFATNSALQKGVDDLPERLDFAFTDIEIFLNQTVKQVNYLTNENFVELRTGFDVLMTEAGRNVTQLIDEIKNDISYDELMSYSKYVVNDLINFNNETAVGLSGLIGIAEKSLQEFQTTVNPIISQIDTAIDSVCKPQALDCKFLDDLKAAALEVSALDFASIKPPNVPEVSQYLQHFFP